MAAIFPKWTNKVPLVIFALGPVVLTSVVGAVWYWFSPSFTDVGYRPTQPVAFSHALHAGDLGMDCRYCHNTVEVAARAAIPATAICMNCHAQVRTDSPKLAKVRDSYETGAAIEWVRVHQLPDYAYFNHAPHIAAGVGCASCHGRIDQMETVALSQPLSMGWCLECHRDPTPNLRPLDKVTDMNWDPATANYDPTADPARARQVNPPEHCSGCHR